MASSLQEVQVAVRELRAKLEQRGLPLESMDPTLLHATTELRNFLLSVPPCLVRPGPALSAALRRYETIWLPLLAKTSQLPDSRTLVPPPDVAWVWIVHLLAPEHYHEDMAKIGWSSAPSLPAANNDTKGRNRYSDESYVSSETAWNDFCTSMRAPPPSLAPGRPCRAWRAGRAAWRSTRRRRR